jgi:hypothetical protein
VDTIIANRNGQIVYRSEKFLSPNRGMRWQHRTNNHAMATKGNNESLILKGEIG